MDKMQEALVIKYMPTADKIAYAHWKRASYALELSELKAIAYKGLCESADRWYDSCEEKGFDPSQTQFFYVVAKRRINGAIIDAFRQTDWASRSLRARSRQLRNAGQDQGASVAEMSETSGISEKKINETIRDMGRRPVSIEAEEIDYASVQSTESSAVVDDMLQVLVEVIKSLDKIGQVILALHYYEHRELQDISKILGITEARSSKIHTDSVTKIRCALASAAAGNDWRDQ